MSGFDDDDNVPTYTHLKPVDNKRMVNEVGGLQARQPLRDGMIDNSFRQRGPNLKNDLAADIHRGSGGRGQVSETLRKMDEIGDLSIDDFMDAKIPLDEKRAFVKSMQRFGNATNKTPVARNDDPFSDNAFGDEPVGRFVVEKATASLKSGSKIPVWMVVDSTNGKQYPNPFKINEAAYSVASLLNEHGTVTHPSVKKALAAYDTYTEILKRITSVKKAIAEGEVERKPQLTSLREQLQLCGKVIGL